MAEQYQVVGKRHIRFIEKDGKREREVYEIGDIIEPTDDELEAFGDKFRHVPSTRRRQRDADADDDNPDNKNPANPAANVTPAEDTHRRTQEGVHRQAGQTGQQGKK